MSNPTTPFGWQMPTATDLVTDLPADFAVFGQAVATSMADLLGGTTGQILAKNSSTDMDFVWIANDQGDITEVTAGTGLTGGGTSGAVTLAIDSTVATLSGSQTLTNKALTAPKEVANVVAAAATGTININAETSTVWYYTTNATANHTLNFRWNSTTTLASKLAVGESITFAWLNTNGTTAYYPNVIQIDGTTVTPKVPAAISSGNASAIDAYVFTIIKTAATPTYTVFESQTKFA